MILFCSDSASDKFFFKFKNDGTTPVTKKCSFLQGKNKNQRKQICKKKAPVDSGYLSAKDVCPETCGNCCAVEIEHLENEKEDLENRLENSDKLVERFEYILKLYGIDF